MSEVVATFILSAITPKRPSCLNNLLSCRITTEQLPAFLYLFRGIISHHQDRRKSLEASICSWAMHN
jgi:hypothetical protein